MSELKVLQAVRLKGLVNPADVADTIDEDRAAVADTIADLVESGLLVGSSALRLSPSGRQHLTDLLAAERHNVDGSAIAAVYHDFGAVNADFKALVLDWQVKDGGVNTHDDTDYDAWVLTRLDAVHRRLIPIITAAAAQIPRLNPYADKLRNALEKVNAGDAAWLTRPLVDSYHTVLWELHEELILAAGLTRADEAKAGRAQ